MNRELAGIDFIPDATAHFGYACLEVNAIPQLTSGYDVAVKMAEFTNSI
jgi:D-alanine-D-alanine ligase-like ATP-grasp enzyme